MDVSHDFPSGFSDEFPSVRRFQQATQGHVAQGEILAIHSGARQLTLA